MTIAQKIQKIQSLDKSFAFRLAAITAADTRKGKIWTSTKTKTK